MRNRQINRSDNILDAEHVKRPNTDKNIERHIFTTIKQHTCKHFYSPPPLPASPIKTAGANKKKRIGRKKKTQMQPKLTQRVPPSLPPPRC